MYAINRSAVVVKLRQPYRGWARPSAGALDPAFGGAAGFGSVYLFPEFEDQEQGEALLREAYGAIFESQLLAWGLDESVWPKERDWQTFHEWFEVELHGDVYEMVDEEVVNDDELGFLDGNGYEIE